MSEPRDSNGLKLLSLGASLKYHARCSAPDLHDHRSDGGGIRGLSELLILKEIMERIRVRENREEAPLPCDYFDLIGGTSTGGWVFTVIVMSRRVALVPDHFPAS